MRAVRDEHMQQQEISRWGNKKRTLKEAGNNERKAKKDKEIGIDILQKTRHGSTSCLPAKECSCHISLRHKHVHVSDLRGNAYTSGHKK